MFILREFEASLKYVTLKCDLIKTMLYKKLTFANAENIKN